MSPAEKPLHLDAVVLARVVFFGVFLPEDQGLFGGLEGLARLACEQTPLGAVGPDDA